MPTLTRRDATRDASGAARRRWVVPVAGVAVALLAVAVLAELPWEWSFIDDSGMVNTVRWEIGQHGWTLGTWAALRAYIAADVEWGLFRPSFYPYEVLFYQLPTGLAHALRIGALAPVFLGATTLAARGMSGRHRWVRIGLTAAVVAANTTLYAGIWYPSLQELSGLCLVGLGLLGYRRPWLVALCFLGAAWFKTPFGWLLLGYGVLLLRRRPSRPVGAVAVALALGTFGAAAWLARGGSYTGRVAEVSASTVAANAFGGLRPLVLPGAAVLLGALLLGARPVRSAADPYPLALLLGGLGYLCNLLIWRTDGYYVSPYVYLISVGGLLVLFGGGTRGEPSGRRVAAALVVPVLAAVHCVSSAAVTGWRTHATVTGLRDCVERLPGSPVVGFNRPEGWLRLDQIVRQHRPDWPGIVALVPNGSHTGDTLGKAVTRIDYYIHDPGYGPGTSGFMTGPVVCRTPYATVYRVP